MSKCDNHSHRANKFIYYGKRQIFEWHFRSLATLGLVKLSPNLVLLLHPPRGLSFPHLLHPLPVLGLLLLPRVEPLMEAPPPLPDLLAHPLVGQVVLILQQHPQRQVVNLATGTLGPLLGPEQALQG